nr:MAG TPA: hypothetical protein [Caudoviricetes sp.]
MNYILKGTIETEITKDEYKLLHDTLIKYRINQYISELIR